MFGLKPIPALQFRFEYPVGIAFRRSDASLLVSDFVAQAIFRIDAIGLIHRFAGSGVKGVAVLSEYGRIILGDDNNHSICTIDTTRKAGGDIIAKGGSGKCRSTSYWVAPIREGTRVMEAQHGVVYFVSLRRRLGIIKVDCLWWIEEIVTYVFWRVGSKKLSIFFLCTIIISCPQA